MVRIYPETPLDGDGWVDLPAIAPMTAHCLSIMAKGMAEPFRLRFKVGNGWGPSIDVPAGVPFSVPGPTHGNFAQAQRMGNATSVQVIEII